MGHRPGLLSLALLLGAPIAVTAQDGWRVPVMAQALPLLSIGGAGFESGPLEHTDVFLSQPVLMANVESPRQRWVLRTTLNFEPLTLDEGEPTPGGWGEGYIDVRHPHNLLHEAMLSLNLWGERTRGSVSAGKGFAPYGTPDPMSRPVVKYPTNHHLSQILERWTVNAVVEHGGWSFEAGVFGGTEPRDPYDFSNVETFGDSWSARIGYRWEHDDGMLRLYGSGAGVLEPAEPQLDLPGILPEDDHPRLRKYLANVAIERMRATRGGRLYWLFEASKSWHAGQRGFFALLAEAAFARGPHRPYARIEYAARPEFARFGMPGSDAFFRYGFEDEAIGGTRWLLATVGWGTVWRRGSVGAGPFVELQFNRISADWGGFDPDALYGAGSGTVLTLGFRVRRGGETMRMGSYGVLDSMTRMSR